MHDANQSNAIAVIDVRRCTVAELEAAPNLFEVLNEYEAESPVPELGVARPDIEAYRRLERLERLYPIGAFDGEMLSGFALPISANVPHFSKLIVTSESFFVVKADRKRGIGMRLLAALEDVAYTVGARGLFISAPTGSVLAQVMHKLKRYRHSNEVFVMGFA